MRVTPLSDAVGAEIEGVDAEQLVADDALPAAIMDALERHGVLVFRDLHLDPEAQVEFCSRLGDIDRSPGHHPVPGIYRVTLDPSKNANADYLKGTFVWHIDG
jgi:alpha-ketoglutarate-dependent taurine dioxygenase